MVDRDLESIVTIDFDNRDDVELLAYCQEGNYDALEYLINKYKNFVRAKARSYFLVGADQEDVIQEGMIGLYKAIRNYDGSKTNSFKSFAEVCITRQMITAIKTATRQKHIPLNSYISLDKPVYEEDSDRTLMDILCENKYANPEFKLLCQEELKSLELRFIEVLSEFEIEVLNLYLDGRTYQEISTKLKREVKSIDNALQRIKRKMEKYVDYEYIV